MFFNLNPVGGAEPSDHTKQILVDFQILSLVSIKFCHTDQPRPHIPQTKTINGCGFRNDDEKNPGTWDLLPSPVSGEVLFKRHPKIQEPFPPQREPHLLLVFTIRSGKFQLSVSSSLWPIPTFFQSLPTSAAEPNPLLAQWDNTAQQKGAETNMMHRGKQIWRARNNK